MSDNYCSRQEIKQIATETAQEVEKRMELRFEMLKEHHERDVLALEERWQHKLEESHMIVAGTVSNFGSDLRDLNNTIKGIDWDSLKSWSDLMAGAASFKKIVTGFGAVVIALGAIGGSVLYMVKHFKI